MNALRRGADTSSRALTRTLGALTLTVEMAEAQQSDGQFKPAVDLAGDIVDSQSAEIETMEGLLS